MLAQFPPAFSETMSTIFNVKTTHRPHGFTLNTLDLSVHFHGNVCFKDVPECIPVQVSIRLADEWAGLSPVVHNVSTHKLTPVGPLNPIMFPFLPLPSGFEPAATCQWQQLAEEIERCLLADTCLNNKYPECYRLMRDLFWMAFVASFPAFPQGDWPLWDAWIAMEGEFISSWVLKDEDDEVLDTLLARQAIWEQFKATVEQMLLIPATQ